MGALQTEPHLRCRVGSQEGERVVAFSVHNVDVGIDLVSKVPKGQPTIASLDEGVLGSKEIGCEGLVHGFGVGRVVGWTCHILKSSASDATIVALGRAVGRVYGFKEGMV